MRDVSPNTLAALQDARKRGRLVKRDFIWFEGRHRETGALEPIGIWSDAVARTVEVVRPSDGVVVTRVYQPGGGRMQIPAIPSTLKLEVRRIRLTFSRLSQAVINAVKVYDVKGQTVEIHRGLLDPDTMNFVDPCHCRFDGFVRSVRSKRAKVGETGVIIVEIEDHSASLRPNPVKISKSFFEDRDGDRGGDHVNMSGKTVWGQEVVVKERKRRPRVRLWR